MIDTATRLRKAIIKAKLRANKEHGFAIAFSQVEAEYRLDAIYLKVHDRKTGKYIEYRYSNQTEELKQWKHQASTSSRLSHAGLIQSAIRTMKKY